VLSHVNKKFNYAGDTIVEVLMAIAIAAFAIGTSYAIANRSLQHAISARERNEAVNLMEDQIANLKVRYKASPEAFKSDDPTKGFVVTSTYSTVNVPEFHFCLADNIKGKDDPLWARSPNQTNVFSSTVTPDDLRVGTAGSGYNINCKRTFGGTDFFVDIEAYITPASQGLANKTVYRVNVRWPEIGTGQKNNAVVYYRL
jgi:Tfp pilus assembly protein PilV